VSCIFYIAFILTVENEHAIVIEHGVTEQWSYADSDPDFCTIIRLIAHYISLLQQCMAVALVWSWKLTRRRHKIMAKEVLAFMV
jgi:hypothetical protein